MQQNLFQLSYCLVPDNLERHKCKATTTTRVLVSHYCHVHYLAKLLKISLDLRL